MKLFNILTAAALTGLIALSPAMADDHAEEMATTEETMETPAMENAAPPAEEAVKAAHEKGEKKGHAKKAKHAKKKKQHKNKKNS
jgi:hypothetical protein